jgi:succinate-acetate transporter protein
MANTANPAPLGLMGFGMTTVLLNIHNAGLFPLGSMILAMGIFYGGLAQILAGVMEYRNGNTFGTTAFTSYGLFWLSLVAILVLPQIGWAEVPAPEAMGAYLAMWGFFTAAMFIGTLKIGRGLQFVFLTLTLLFFLLAAGEFVDSSILGTITGVEGVICGFSAIYVAIGSVWNELYGRTVIPI